MGLDVKVVCDVSPLFVKLLLHGVDHVFLVRFVHHWVENARHVLFRHHVRGIRKW